MKKLVIFLFVSSALFVLGVSPTHGEESCYELGYKCGLCSTQTMNGIPCAPENDGVMPERCREKEETQRGMKAGVKAVYDTLNLDTKRQNKD